MSQKVLLLHGWGGSDFPHWQSWLAAELAKEYGTVSFVKLDNPEFPDKDKWLEQLKKHLQDFKPDIVICHSLANILWFHLCNEESRKNDELTLSMPKIKKLFLVAPPSIDSNIEELKSFFPVKPPKNLHAEDVILVTSTNDPYLSVAEANALQKSLGVEMLLLQNAGHINAQSGYGEWPWILEQLNT